MLIIESVHSIIVEGLLDFESPPSIIRSTAESLNCFKASLTLVAGDNPDLLALVPVMPLFILLVIPNGTTWSGTLHPTVAKSPVRFSGTEFDLSTIKVRAPGQNSAAKAFSRSFTLSVNWLICEKDPIKTGKGTSARLSLIWNILLIDVEFSASAARP